MDLNVGPLTPKRVLDSWTKLVGAYDQVLGNDTFRAFLGSEMSFEGAREIFAALDARRTYDPEFFVQHDYTWASDACAYSRPIEVAFQVRVLDAAIGLWKSDAVGRNAAPRLERIAVRSTYMSRLQEASPVVREFEGIAFIICPMAWPEALEWFFAGLAAYAGADTALDRAATWSKFLAPECNANAASRHVLSLVANLLASVGCPHDVLMPQAVSAIREHIDAFKEAVPGLHQAADTSVSKDLSYLAVEMALSHEVGHILRGDHVEGASVDEQAADILGMVGFVNSWDWRHWCLEGLLGNIGRLTLAVASYWHFLPTFYAITRLVARATSDTETNDERDKHLDDLIRRGRGVMHGLDGYLSRVGTSSSWKERSSDEQQIHAFFETICGYQRHLIEYVRGIPVPALRGAIRLSQQQRRD